MKSGIIRFRSLLQRMALKQFANRNRELLYKSMLRGNGVTVFDAGGVSLEWM
jgi:hypothetical protein